MSAETVEQAEAYCWIAIARCGCVPSVATAEFIESEPKELAEFLTSANRFHQTALRVSRTEFREKYAHALRICPHTPLYGTDVDNDDWYACHLCHTEVGVRQDRRTRKHWTRRFVETERIDENHRRGYSERVVCKGSGLTFAELSALRSVS